MTDCVQEMEDTRREMFKVAKTVVKLKDEILMNKTSHINPDAYKRQGSNNSSSPSPNKGFSYQISAISPPRFTGNEYAAVSPRNQLG